MTSRTSPQGPVARAVPMAPALSRTSALLTALALTLSVLVAGVVAAPPASASNVEDNFTAALNQARAARGIAKLTSRPRLVSVARSWAAAMANQSKLSHNPNLTSKVNNWRWVGENVGYGPNATAVHVAFMDSPAHRANILDRDYTEVGIGAVVRDGRVWVAQVFRQPLRVTTSSVQRSYGGSLRLGDRGAAVKRIQGRLGLKQTGHYGRATAAAVSRFQKQLGWQGRGVVGRQTWAHLF